MRILSILRNIGTLLADLGIAIKNRILHIADLGTAIKNGIVHFTDCDIKKLFIITISSAVGLGVIITCLFLVVLRTEPIIGYWKLIEIKSAGSAQKINDEYILAGGGSLPSVLEAQKSGNIYVMCPTAMAVSWERDKDSRDDPWERGYEMIFISSSGGADEALSLIYYKTGDRQGELWMFLSDDYAYVYDKTTGDYANKLREKMAAGMVPGIGAVEESPVNTVPSVTSGAAEQGASMVSVPDLTGKARKDAESIILSANLAVGNVTYKESYERGNTVLSQDPASGILAAPNNRVNLNLSLGEGCVAGYEVFGEQVRTDSKGYVLEESSYEILGDIDFKGLSELELTIARNEIYARNGQIFDEKNAKVQDYFNMQPWYKSITNKQEGDISLNDVERYNVGQMTSYAVNRFGKASYFG